MPETSLTITRITAQAFRVPIEVPVATSFGIMRNRPAVFVRIEDADGCHGWGEAFANWPAAGAEHRVNLLADDVADLVMGRAWPDPGVMFDTLTRATRIRALQCGEPGPFAQVIAALDIAAWDLVARRAGLPVARMLAPDAAARVPAYASGIHIDAAGREIQRARTLGFAAFKVKVGFDIDTEPDKLTAIRDSLSPGERLFTDANQAWDTKRALFFLTRARPEWIEEPIPADAPAADWQRLAATGVPLAGGENITGMAAFVDALPYLTYVQPDVAKWGGITGCLAVARQTLAAGRTYCPHFLGGGIGLMASAHVLAAAGGPGLLEVDVNPNILRGAICDLAGHVRDGSWHLSNAPGLGIDALPPVIAAQETLRRDVRA
ncbi:mandelate racemase/muconate lactonizing enzyme family protein [Paracoccus sp. 22332]|uniref:mandelate racemase/muconate lactonizing enzyme family protein n=1 Tax=Paracoccus sp. 22332 TaxID=3453913 RepID=UPI003F84F3E4